MTKSFDLTGTALFSSSMTRQKNTQVPDFYRIEFDFFVSDFFCMIVLTVEYVEYKYCRSVTMTIISINTNWPFLN